MFTQLHPSVTKEQYDSIRRHAINDHELGYYEEIDQDPLGFGKWPNEPHPTINIPSPSPPPPPPGPLKRQFASERIPSESFGEELIRTTNINRTRIEKEKEF